MLFKLKNRLGDDAAGKAMTREMRRGISLPRPALWNLLLVLALPFFVTVWPYFEALEKTGWAGELFAPPLLSASFFGYLFLVWQLKRQTR